MTVGCSILKILLQMPKNAAELFHGPIFLVSHFYVLSYNSMGTVPVRERRNFRKFASAANSMLTNYTVIATIAIHA